VASETFIHLSLIVKQKELKWWSYYLYIYFDFKCKSFITITKQVIQVIDIILMLAPMFRAVCSSCLNHIITTYFRSIPNLGPLHLSYCSVYKEEWIQLIWYSSLIVEHFSLYGWYRENVCNITWTGSLNSYLDRMKVLCAFLRWGRFTVCR